MNFKKIVNFFDTQVNYNQIDVFFIKLVYFYHSDEFSTKRWIFTKVKKFPSKLWIFVGMKSYHSDEFHQQIYFSLVLNFHQQLSYQSNNVLWVGWTIIKKINFHNLINVISFHKNGEFSTRWRTLIKMMDFIDMMIFHQNSQFSLKW